MVGGVMAMISLLPLASELDKRHDVQRDRSARSMPPHPETDVLAHQGSLGAAGVLAVSPPRSWVPMRRWSF